MHRGSLSNVYTIMIPLSRKVTLQYLVPMWVKNDGYKDSREAISATLVLAGNQVLPEFISPEIPAQRAKYCSPTPANREHKYTSN